MRRTTTLLAGVLLALASQAHAEPAPGFDAQGFEPPSYQAGPLQGQAGWRAVELGAGLEDVLVSADDAYAGKQAVQLKNVGHRVIARLNLVQRRTFYVDVMLKLPPKEAIKANPSLLLRGRGTDNKPAIRVVVSFNGGGGVNDVPAGAANRYTAGQWTRVTVKIDFETQTWSLYLNGQLAGAGLAFQGGQPIVQIDTFDFDWTSQPDAPGAGLLLDNFTIGHTDPLALAPAP